MSKERPRGRRLRVAVPLFVAMFALGGLIGCQSPAPGQGGFSGAGAGTVRDVAGPSMGNADEFLIVDCLLPAQVRRLGRQLTYLGAQRAIRAPAVECEIRGGEYVAYDRANFDTALQVWLGPAREGDPQAQNYVGEIFERGLGRQPDYAQAAEWYRRAAEQDFAPAQINLGQLYEQGLGVPRDQIQAINWYRRASGFEEAGLSFVVSSDVAQELTDLRDAVLLRESDADRLREQIKGLEREMAQLEAARRAAEAQATQVEAQVQPAPEAAPGPEVAAALEEIERARAELQAEREAVEEQRRLATQAARELEEIEAALATERQLLIDKEREIEAQRAQGVEDQQARAEAEQLLADLALKQIEFQRRSEELAERDAEIAQREQLAQLRAADIAELEARIAERDAVLAEREEAIEARQGELSELDQKIAQLQKTFEEQRAQLAQLSRAQPISLAGPEIELIDPVMPTELTRSGLPVVWTRPNIIERPVIGKIDAPAGLLSLLFNDQPLELGDNNTFQQMVPISTNGTKVSVVAVDRQGKRDAKEFLLVPETQTAALTSDALVAEPAAAPARPAIDFGNYHALVIGINDYSHIPKLQTAIADAEAVGRILAERYGFEVQVLRDPNRYQILSALNQLRARLTENDNLLIYYAGHGELDQANQRGHWLPVDAEADSDANWISNVALTDILNTMSARQVIVIADSCYSGALTRSALTQIEAGRTQAEQIAWLKTMASKRSRVAFTSGALAPTLDGGGGGHSVFARALLDALAANNEVIDGQRLYRQVAARVAYVADQVRFEQLPQYAPIKHSGHEAGDFFFVPLEIGTS
jgi:hypothetical protein